MTNERKTRDLAEKVMGYEVIRNGHTVKKTSPARCLWEYPHGLYFHLPNSNQVEFSPFNSRDDCHEVLAKMPMSLHYLVLEHLKGELCSDEDSTFTTEWKLFTATPAQISEAAWRAVCQ